jgi:hypothetical protein
MILPGTIPSFSQSKEIPDDTQAASPEGRTLAKDRRKYDQHARRVKAIFRRDGCER